MDVAEAMEIVRHWNGLYPDVDQEAASVLAAEVERLRARVAELEAGEVVTEWGNSYGDGYVEVADSESDAEAWADEGTTIVSRQVRRGPWMPTGDAS